MPAFPGMGPTNPKSEPKRLAKRPSKGANAGMPGAAKSVSITDRSTEARPSSAPKTLKSRP